MGAYERASPIRKKERNFARGHPIDFNLSRACFEFPYKLYTNPDLLIYLKVKNIMKRKIFKFAAIAMMLATGFSCTQNLNIEPTLPELDTRAAPDDTSYIRSGWNIGAINADNLNVIGNYIRVAVLDTGVDMKHPDLSDHIVDEGGYDAFIPAWGDDYGGPVYISNNTTSSYSAAHGTACAGIVVAVAPGCKLIPVRRSDDDNQVAAAINWAWREAKADVISCSWELNSGDYDSTTAALDSAMTYGRGGLGCVVVFAAGNSGADDSINDIAASNERFLVVGAINDTTYTRWSGSSKGPQLDVMAPGVNIPTTDICGGDGRSPNNYCLFWATSSATPHVAGVAALILSYNPNLSSKQVHDIITSTAGAGNGTRSDEMGYGVVNAYRAINDMKDVIYGDLSITGSDTVQSNTQSTYSVPVPPGATVTWSVSPNSGYTVQGGINDSTLNITFTATGNYTVKANFSMQGYLYHSLSKTVNVFDPNALPQIAISGSGTAAAGDIVTYTIPSPLPSGATFTGWTPISNATATSGWNSPTLSVYFHSAGTRTLTANFKMPAPDNRTFTSTMNVQVSLPSVFIDVPYAMYRDVPDTIHVELPEGATFTGWTPIPDATPSPNWNSPTLSLTFNNIGTYTLIANFSIGGVTFTRTNTINVYPVYPDIIGPTEVDSYSSAQYSLTPSPLPSYISFNGWRIVPLDPANQQTPMIYSPMNQTSSIYFNDVGEYYLIAEFYITGYGSYSTQKIVRSNLPFSYFYPYLQSVNIGGGYMRVNVTNIPSSFANNYDIRYQWEVNGQIASYYSYQPIEVPSGTSVRFRVTLGSQTSPWGYP